ncbi:MAG: SRPBCC family protein [Ignavibacteriales bacterium]|nr:SRPBCC family protein [Ignavibacteriales bacterium]
MKTFKKILIVIAIIIAVPLIVALFVKKGYTVTREVVINKPNKEVFEFVKYLQNQNKYSKWVLIDPEMKKTFSGTDGTPGFVSAWSSDNKDVGKGEQEIKKVTEGSRIDYEIRFIEPFTSTSPAYMSTSAISENQTKVTWSFTGDVPYPMNLMYLMMDFEKLIGDDLVTGLTNLKILLEK